MRGFGVVVVSLGLAGCFMNPDPFAPERDQALTGSRALTPEQQQLEDWQRQQAALERQRRIEEQQRTEEQQREQAQQQDETPAPADGTQPVVEETTRTVRRLTPQVRTTPRPSLGLPAGGVVVPAMLPPLLGR